MTNATLGDSVISVCRRFLAEGPEAVREGDSVPSAPTCEMKGSLCIGGSVVAKSVYHNENSVKQILS